MTAETVLKTETVPAVSTVSAEDLDAVAAILRGRRTAVLTGAGLSTDSGIPDYRGAGAPVRVPMTFQHFLADERARKRYWAGSHLGWHRFRAAQPNLGHRSLVTLEAAGLVSGVITQNVDGLHTRAGSRHVVDLHGSMDLVVCLSCGQAFGRDSIAARLEAHNPVLANPEQVEIAPDGDAIVVDIDGFTVPDCSVCGGLLKPNVVFFGELVPTGKFTAAAALVRSADALVVAGSSLAVNSGIRLLELARRRKLPIVVINRGATKGDSRALVKLEAGTSETFAGLVTRLTD